MVMWFMSYAENLQTTAEENHISCNNAWVSSSRPRPSKTKIMGGKAKASGCKAKNLGFKAWTKAKNCALKAEAKP